ncbi:MAG: hypothetical protein ABSB26_06870 [Nitrososphaerales archaeon]|jgi:hypothetical protein
MSVKKRRAYFVVVAVLVCLGLFLFAPVLKAGGRYVGCTSIECANGGLVNGNWNAQVSASYYLFKCGAFYNGVAVNDLGQTVGHTGAGWSCLDTVSMYARIRGY